MTLITVLSPHLPPAFLDLLRRQGEVRAGVAPDAATRIVVATPADRIDAGFVEVLPPAVGLIASLGVGTDHIDLAAVRARGIAASNTPVVTEDTADLAMALLLAACRRVPQAGKRLRAGDWGGAQSIPATRVHGKTLGIVGLGAIGRAVARRAAGFGMPLRYWGPRRRPEAENETGARWCVSLEELLGSSDVVSLHCPLTGETHHLIDAARLAQFRRGAVLVNTGRGALVDEAALAAALASGQLGAAALDVFEAEPRVSPALLALDNAVLTPHIGSATVECRIEMALRVAANIEAFLAHGTPLDAIA